MILERFAGIAGVASMLLSAGRGRFLAGGGVLSTLADLSFLVFEGSARSLLTVPRKGFLILRVTIYRFACCSSSGISRICDLRALFEASGVGHAG